MSATYRTAGTRGRSSRLRAAASSIGSHAVGRFVAPSSYSVGLGESLASALATMRARGALHLPVLQGGKLAGILHQRELCFIESLAGLDLRGFVVDDAISPDTYGVSAATPVEEVAAEMADHGYGCAVVMDGTRVFGVFSANDALAALAQLPRPAAPARGT